MSVVLDRLRMLAAQSGRARPVAVEPLLPRGPRLRELLGQRVPRGAPLPGVEIAPGLRVIEERVPLEPQPGNRVCIDTETTGLAGGSGTIAFLVGVARFRGGALELTQWLLTRIGSEGAMLDALAAWLEPDDELASYNGKCFDRPLLSTRYRLRRRVDPLLGRAHHDLLHAVRRRYRREWANCRLLTAERELLGVVRDDDLPGAQAPAAWRAFLRSGATTDLARVATHNRQDLVSLARIAARLLD